METKSSYHWKAEILLNVLTVWISIPRTYFILGILTVQVYSVTSMCSCSLNYRLCCPNTCQCQTLRYHWCASKYSSVLDFSSPLCKVGRRTSFPGRLRKKKKDIYIAAAVQRLQEAWHVPVCPAEVADSTEVRPSIYHVDAQLMTGKLPPSTA